MLTPSPLLSSPPTLPVTMLLSDLVKHVPVQDEAIGQISPLLDSNAPLCNSWNAVRELFWEKGLENLEEREPVERDDAPLMDIPEPPSHRCVLKVPLCVPWIWLNLNDRILVWTAYRTTEDAAVSAVAEGLDLFVIFGSPGIGMLSGY